VHEKGTQLGGGASGARGCGARRPPVAFRAGACRSSFSGAWLRHARFGEPPSAAAPLGTVSAVHRPAVACGACRASAPARRPAVACGVRRSRSAPATSGRLDGLLAGCEALLRGGASRGLPPLRMCPREIEASEAHSQGVARPAGAPLLVHCKARNSRALGSTRRDATGGRCVRGPWLRCQATAGRAAARRVARRFQRRRAPPRALRRTSGSGSDGGSVRIQPNEGRTTLRVGDLSTRKLGRDDKGGAAPESRDHRRVVATGLGSPPLSPVFQSRAHRRVVATELGHLHLSPSVLFTLTPRPNTEPHHTNPPLARRPATTVIPLSSVRDRFSGSDGGSVRIQPDEGRTTLRAGDLSTRKLGRDDKGGAAPESRAHRRVVATGLGSPPLSPVFQSRAHRRVVATELGHSHLSPSVLFSPAPRPNTEPHHTNPPLARRPATTVIPLSSVRDRFSGSDGGSVRIQPDEGRTTLRVGDLSTRKLGRDDKGGAAPESRDHRRVMATGLGSPPLSPVFQSRAHRRVVATGLGHSHLSPSVLVSPAPRPNTEPHHTNPPLARRPATTVIPLSSVRDRFSGSDGGSVRIQPDEGRTTLRAGDLSTRKLGRDDKGGAAPESRAHRRVVATGLGHSHLSPSVLVSPAPRPNTEPHHTNPPLARRPATTVIPLSSSETTRLVR
jgi:hypothetical protein